MGGGVSGWYKLLPELEGQAYNIPCVVEDKMQAIEDEMSVCNSVCLFILVFVLLKCRVITYFHSTDSV